MGLRIGKMMSKIGKLGKMMTAKGTQVKNFSLFPMKRENAGCLTLLGTIFLTGLIGSNMGGGGSTRTASVARTTEEPDENITAQAQASEQDMDEIIEKYGFSSLDPLGKLTSVEFLDTLKFFSVEDSLAYDRINRYANGLYEKACQDAQIAYNEADSISQRKWFVADSIGTARWAEYDKKEREALNNGDLDAVRRYRDLKYKAIADATSAKEKVIADEVSTKEKVIADGESAKSDACQREAELMQEARQTLGVFVRPYQIKAE